MSEDLAIIDNEVYDLGLQEIEEASNIQKQIMELGRERNEKLEEAKIHLILGVKVKTRELQDKLKVCNSQISFYHQSIAEIKDDIKINKGLEGDTLNQKLQEAQQCLNLWVKKKEEIKVLLKELCKRYGHQIDISEEPIKIKKNTVLSVSETLIAKNYIWKSYYICKCCGEKVLLDDNFNLKDMEWHNMLNANFTKRIVDEKVSLDNPKLVLGKPKVILPNVDK